jgi:hypothetical protein
MMRLVVFLVRFNNFRVKVFSKMIKSKRNIDGCPGKLYASFCAFCERKKQSLVVLQQGIAFIANIKTRRQQ